MEDRQREILTCRRELDELKDRVRKLSVRLDRLEGKAEVPAVSVRQKKEPDHQENRPIPVRKQDDPAERTNLESLVGRNLFAVLASVLVLLGVGVFISTIYEQIPEVVKIGAIYLFGFVMLGSGLVIYRKNGNKFWLGVASCGLAELLVSIITSHSYFHVLSLPWTFVLVLVWILGSFWLTRFQPTVFKIIGYCGLIISMLLGLSLVGRKDTLTYMVLAGAYLLLASFFMVTHREKVKLNTALALCSTLALGMFLQMERYLQEHLDWLPAVWVLGALIIFHTIYLAVAKLHPKAYPFFAGLSLWVGSIFVSPVPMTVFVPVVLGLILVLCYLVQKSSRESVGRICFLAMVGLYLFNLCTTLGVTQDQLRYWFPVAALLAVGLYRWTGQWDGGWLSLILCGVFCVFPNSTHDSVPWGFAVTAAYFTLYSSPLVRKDKNIRIAWYLLTAMASWHLVNWIRYRICATGAAYGPVTELCFGVYFAVMALVNTVYLHLRLRDREKILRVDMYSVLVMVPQALFMFGCLSYVGSDVWYISGLGVAGSLLTLAYSLHYSLKTRGTDRRLTVWQFVKFTLYCWYVLVALSSPDILVNITLLLIAVAAVALGFRLGHKAVRIYGLVLSLVDVVSLVLFRIDFSDSLQLAGGIVLCGVLCFVISFIYSRISRTSWNKDTVESPEILQ
jgi:hypothetical protein